jgi:hypothetical protein
VITGKQHLSAGELQREVENQYARKENQSVENEQRIGKYPHREKQNYQSAEYRYIGNQPVPRIKGLIPVEIIVVPVEEHQGQEGRQIFNPDQPGPRRSKQIIDQEIIVSQTAQYDKPE